MKGWKTPKPNANIRLNIGSGSPKIAHEQYPDIPFLCQDVVEHEGMDLVCDIRELKRYIDDGECEYIMAVHVIEHFGTKEIDDIFSMIYGLLKQGGRFDIIVPNLQYHLQLILTGEDEKAVYYCFGGQDDEYDYHKTGFTPKILRSRLEKAGFMVVNFQEDASILANCVKTGGTCR